MRMAELSAASGVPVPTLKYYLREALLPPGEATAPNQASYSDAHLQRIRLIGVLTDVGGLTIAAVRNVVAALDQPALPLSTVVAVVHHALTPASDDPSDADAELARREIDSWLAELGWQISAAAPSRRTLADALVSLRRLGRTVRPQDFARYAAAANRLAAWELSRTVTSPPVTAGGVVESVVIGTVVYETVLLALRRLAQEHQFALRPSAQPGKR